LSSCSLKHRESLVGPAKITSKDRMEHKLSSQQEPGYRRDTKKSIEIFKHGSIGAY